jgi:hypothetical protein
MKLITKALLLFGCLMLSTTALKMTVKKVASASKDDYTKDWEALFKTVVRPPAQCNPPNRLPEPNLEDPREQDLKIPKKKINPFAKLQGFGESAYLWDYLDDAPILGDLTTEMKKMYDEGFAMALPDVQVYDDPFSLQKLIFYYSQGKEDLTGKTVEEQLTAIKKYNTNFNDAIWKISISVPQVYNIFEQWGWFKRPVSDNPRKSVVFFDFNGDGRLSPSEFLYLAIVNNKKVFRMDSCKKGCFTEMLKNRIDPIFAFIDCDADGWISAENMWYGLKNIKRTVAANYDIYACKLPTQFNSDYRTISMNDFVLKNYEKHDGYLNLDEFRRGVLIGFLDRNVDDTKIYQDNTRNHKELRWSADGTKDLQCDKMKEFIPVVDPSKATLDATKTEAAQQKS